MADVSDPGKVALCGLVPGVKPSVVWDRPGVSATMLDERDRQILDLQKRVAELEARISRGYVTTSGPIARSLSDTILSQAARIKELEDQLRVCRAAYHGCQP